MNREWIVDGHPDKRFSLVRREGNQVVLEMVDFGPDDERLWLVSANEARPVTTPRNVPTMWCARYPSGMGEWKPTEAAIFGEVQARGEEPIDVLCQEPDGDMSVAEWSFTGGGIETGFKAGAERHGVTLP